GLGNVDAGNSTLGLQAFQFHVIKEVSGGAIEFVEQDSVELLGTLLGIGDDFFKRFALISLAGSLGDLPELDDRAAVLLCVTLQGFFLHIETEPLALLLTTAHASQGRELF